MADWGMRISLEHALQVRESTDMKDPIVRTFVACLFLWSGSHCVEAGVVSGADDQADSCGSGSGGGDTSHGAAPRRVGRAVTQKMPKGAYNAAPGSDAVQWVSAAAALAKGGATPPAMGAAPAVGEPPAAGRRPAAPVTTTTAAPARGHFHQPGSHRLHTGACRRGMPIWEVSEPYINLWLYDEPLAYQPGIGPRLSFGLAYKQRGEPLATPNLYSLGTNWSCAWLSYVEDRGVWNQAPLILMRGAASTSPTGRLGQGVHTRATLRRQADGRGQVSFVRSYPSGARTTTRTSRSTPGSPTATPRLPERPGRPVRAHNLVFTYEEPLMGGAYVFRLASVTDADGRVTTLSYTNSNPP